MVQETRKCPKWAQKRIEHLEAQVARLESSAATILGGIGARVVDRIKDKTGMGVYLDGTDHGTLYFPVERLTDISVRIRAGESFFNDLTVDCNSEGGFRVSGGMRRMSIRPQASNVVQVNLREGW